MAKKSKKLPASADVAPSPPASGPSYWLLKSEPDVFSWDMLVARGKEGEPWTGVRNYQARNYMREMRLGDLAFFYHSNLGKEVAGVMRVVAPVHPDPTDDTGTWECVDVKAVVAMPSPVPLAAIRQAERLRDMVLVTNSRLSVQPVSADHWREVCRLGGLDARSLKA
jgi:predicted RNA-binding protein with PUA-like domain